MAPLLEALTTDEKDLATNEKAPRGKQIAGIFAVGFCAIDRHVRRPERRCACLEAGQHLRGYYCLLAGYA